ncbi:MULTISPECIES: NADP-dependent oxidoreductase [Catenuloplanes]|uniref:NADPH:quinone reductase-like Zn-dependent oxidoreductase n=1 Tax=Catenuloplanes niger TaxID=587534 RepID=A0AAE4CRX2_9ACTN|nr:NADP-dependent oxidoreductase [Catenuloplanes niger]MDR7320578.1 NADPH:quinone reductase-like Zn-dependent oxidoreductase [Catenuloplanes niger]
MKAVRFDRYGGPEVLRVAEVPRPAPRPDQVLVEVVSAALNPGEIGIREGVFARIWPARFPEGQGNDFSGVVTEVGAEVGDVTPGQHVLGFAPRAAQAEFVAVDATALAPKPSGLGWDEAATVAGAGATAWAAVAAVDPRPGETVVVSAAAGGVGSFAAQLAAWRGARVIGTAGDGNLEFLASLGMTPVRYGPGLLDRIREVAPAGVDAYIDTFGAGNVDTAVALGVPPHRINTNADGQAVRRYGVRGDAQEQANTPRIWAELATLAAQGHLTIPNTRGYPLGEVAAAYRDLATRHVRGKRVLHVMAPGRRAGLV